MNKILKNKGIVTAGLLGFLTLLLLLTLIPKLKVSEESKSLGSVTGGNEYTSTTTDSTWTAGITKTLRTGSGALGSVILTLSSTAQIAVYNATTSDINKRTNNLATSTITITQFGASAPAGTYTYDVWFDKGLMVESIGTAGIASSTITFR